MDINSNLPTQQNNTAANVASAAQVQKAPENDVKQVNPAKKSSDTGNDVKTFDQERLVKDALDKNIIKDETQIFNFRVTRYGNNLTFTNVGSGEIVTVKASDVVGNSAVDGNI